MTDDADRLAEMEAQIERLRARVVELEVALMQMRGTLARTARDAPTVITANHPPSAPPHNE
jgi:hypothetical protein